MLGFGAMARAVEDLVRVFDIKVRSAEGVSTRLSALNRVPDLTTRPGLFPADRMTDCASASHHPQKRSIVNRIRFMLEVFE
jgi:hypothetical protein